MIAQDLHIHTIYSSGDSSVVPEQTVELIARVRHAKQIGIADHLEYLDDPIFDEYQTKLKRLGFKIGCEVNGGEWVDRALELPTDYYVYHCWNEQQHYRGLEKLLTKGAPVIVAHPMFLDTRLEKVPGEAYIEINNRYVWRGDWKAFFSPLVQSRQFLFSSDAHQPNWLNQTVARYAGEQLGIIESLLFAR